jgi:hypothetical protein
MPPRYEKLLPRFTSSDGIRANDHLDDIWDFFQLYPINSDVEDLAMNFSLALFMEMIGNGMMISLMLASHLWTCYKKPFSRNGVLNWKTSKCY